MGRGRLVSRHASNGSNGLKVKLVATQQSKFRSSSRKRTSTRWRAGRYSAQVARRIPTVRPLSALPVQDIGVRGEVLKVRHLAHMSAIKSLWGCGSGSRSCDGAVTNTFRVHISCCCQPGGF